MSELTATLPKEQLERARREISYCDDLFYNDGSTIFQQGAFHEDAYRGLRNLLQELLEKFK